MTRNLKFVKESLSCVAMFQSLGESDLEAMGHCAQASRRLLIDWASDEVLVSAALLDA